MSDEVRKDLETLRKSVEQPIADHNQKARENKVRVRLALLTGDAEEVELSDDRKRQEDLKELRKQIEKDIAVYNKKAKTNKEDNRLALLVGRVYIDDDDEEEATDLDILEDPYYDGSVSVSVTTSNEANGWFPSQFCPGY